LITLFLGLYLSFLANTLSVSLNTFWHIYCSASLIALGLVLFYAIVIINFFTPFALFYVKNLSMVVVSIQSALASLKSANVLQGRLSLSLIVLLS
jgi:hypothetical protein